MHRIVAFVLAQGPVRQEGEVSVPRQLKRAPHYFSPTVPPQYLLKREGDVSIKAYMPSVLLVEISREVDDAFSDDALRLRDQMLRECQETVASLGADTSLNEEYAIAVVDHATYEEIQEYFADPSALVSFLKSERLMLTDAEVVHTMQSHIQYTDDDLVVVDWDGACIFEPGEDAEEIIELLQIANYQLLQYRILDQRLDKRLRKVEVLLEAERYHALRRNRELAKAFREMIDVRVRSIAELDSIEREIKLIGDWYSARLYDLASRKLKLPEWNTAIRRKLESLEDIYDIVSERFSISKLHFLEMLQIVLFFILQVGWFALIFFELRYFLSR